jgi:hypothetical protein
MNEDPSTLQLANWVWEYLTEELDRNPNEVIPVHRNIAAMATGLVRAVIESLERQERPLH